MLKKQKVVKDTSERWLLTYADLMNLLLILFIILYTMSKVDTGKYQQVAVSLKSALGVGAMGSPVGQGGGGDSPLDIWEGSGQYGDGTALSPEAREAAQMEGVEKRVKEIIEVEGLASDVEVSIQERGVVISIKDKILFESGSAELDEGARKTIDKIGKVLLAIPGKQIRVEGHTDSDPISSSRYPDNQELSTARANSVLRILVKDVGIDTRILSAAGYGEFRPVAPNTTPENKARNRRVDITILRDKYDDSAAPGVE